MASPADNSGGEDIEHGGGVAVEMTATAATESLSPSSSPMEDAISISDERITPLLNQSQRPRVNIFSVSHSRRRPVKEQITRLAETETSPFVQFTVWIWDGSRYSGMLCMALSSIIYCIMEVLSDVFTAQSIPLFEMAFTRCTVILILSFVWLKRSRQPIFGTSSVRKLLVLSAFMGYLSLLSFIYCIQRVPLSQAIMLNFTTPIVAAVAARVILHEKLKIAEIGGLACSFFGVLFIFRPVLNIQGSTEAGEANISYVKGSNHLYAVLVGLVSSTVGGVSYCFIRAGAKAADQPLLTVFAFGLFATPAAAICAFIFEGFVLPGFYTLLLMVILGSLAFLAEITVARALQLEKTSKVVNILYLQAASTQLLGMSLSRIVPTFGRLVGCTLILISACCTMYVGPEKEVD
ncbi:uncharacterized protein LOC113770574 isoform X1 [Coffea eugenioides]|uniref:uncharacterized protein LOC113770574 isoform X1 n=1 Tax=Coffea eugenioides TaxID=49369 RepID=UPI000F60E564|nr:uncharacterized protein LOC113770574 isoform X1 [Coffea eugenioides]